MAKGKHATALFEVIHASKQFGGKDKAARLLRTPKWWFKGREKQANDPTAGATAVTAATAAPETASGPESAPTASVGDRVRAMAAAASERERERGESSHGPRPAPVDVRVDPDHHQITFKITYTSAIVTGFAVLVVVVLAYLVGRQWSRGPTQAMGGPSTEELRQGPARPDVLNVGGGGNAAAPQSAARDPVHAGNANDGASRVVGGGAGQINRPGLLPKVEQPKLPVASDGKRVQGLNYAIIQGYPDEASAKAAVDILKQNGVGATIEKGLRGYPSNWHVVLGVDGFKRLSNSPEYDAYVKKIRDISDKFANRRSFKAFDPAGYRWDRP